MRERLHVFLAEPTELPALNPRPGSDISDGVFTLAVTGQVLARLAGVLAAQLDLEHTVDSEGFIAETIDGVCVSTRASTWHASSQKVIDVEYGEMQGRGTRTRDLLLCELGKVVHLPLVRRPTAMPKE